MTAIVPVKKVVFGSKEYLFLRTDINALIEERNLLAISYPYNTQHAERYKWITGTLRAIGGNVYFARKPRVAKPEPAIPDVNDIDAYAHYLREKKDKKKQTATKLKPSGKATVGIKRTGGAQGDLF